MKNNLLFISLLVFVNSVVYSQKDYYVSKSNDTIKGRILSFKSNRVIFDIDGNEKSITHEEIKDIHVNDFSKIKKAAGIQVEKPESGFAHVYFFRPYLYVGSALGCKILYNENNFINIKTNTCFVHKIKAGEIHKYEKYSAFKKSKNKIEINAVDGKIYFIRGVYGISEVGVSTNGSFGVGNKTSIKLDDSEDNFLKILSMKKISPKI